MPFFFSQCPKTLARWTSQAAKLGPCALPEILVLDAHGAAGGYGQSGLFTASRLDASFFIRGDDELRAL